MSRNLATFDSTGNYKLKQSSVDALYIRSNVVAIGSGVASIAVSFSSAVPSTSFTVVATMLNSTDTSPQFQPIVITATSTTGFTATWNATTDSANYVLHYQVLPLV